LVVTEHVNTLRLNQYRYGELEGSAADSVRAHLEVCDACRARLQAQQNHRAEFVLSPVPDAILSLSASDQPRWPRWWGVWSTGLAAVAALTLAWVIAPRSTEVDGAEIPEVTRVKGDYPTIEVWLETPEGARPLHEDEALQPGSVVQLLYDPQGAAMVTLVGRDGTGAIEVYRTLEPSADHLQVAPFGLTLDDAPGPQEFFVLTHADPMRPSQVRQVVSAGSTEPTISLAGVTIPKAK